MKLTVTISREVDGRYIGEVSRLRGCLAYGDTKAKAIANAKALALYILSDELEHGERAARTVTQIEFQSRSHEGRVGSW